ncbi:MAG: hypothetical protein ABIJ81_02435 [Patescibacteria group bacterium]
MPVVFAGIVPNSPLLLPGLTPEVQNNVGKTNRALARLSSMLKASKAEVLFIAAEHSLVDQEYYWLLQSNKFPTNFKEYGDLITTREFLVATGFIHALKESLETKISLPLRTPKFLPNSIAVPLIYFNETLPLVPLVLQPGCSPENLRSVAKYISEYFSSSSIKIAVLAAGLMSQGQLGDHAAEQTVFNSAFTNIIKKNDFTDLLNIDSKMRNRTGETLVSPLYLIARLIPSDKLNSSILSLETAVGHTNLVVHLNW